MHTCVEMRLSEFRSLCLCVCAQLLSCWNMRWLHLSLPVAECQRLSTLHRGRLPSHRRGLQGRHAGNTDTHPPSQPHTLRNTHRSWLGHSSVCRKHCTCGMTPSCARGASPCHLGAPLPARPSRCGWRSVSGAELFWPFSSSRSPAISGRKTRGQNLWRCPLLITVVCSNDVRSSLSLTCFDHDDHFLIGTTFFIFSFFAPKKHFSHRPQYKTDRWVRLTWNVIETWLLLIFHWWLFKNQ